MSAVLVTKNGISVGITPVAHVPRKPQAELTIDRDGEGTSVTLTLTDLRKLRAGIDQAIRQLTIFTEEATALQVSRQHDKYVVLVKGVESGTAAWLTRKELKAFHTAISVVLRGTKRETG